jgi:hypothetical protein
MILLKILLSLLAGPVCRDQADVLSLEGGSKIYTEDRMRTPCDGARSRDSVRYIRPDGSVLGTKWIRWRENQDLPEFELRMDAPLKRVSVGFAGDTALIQLDRKGRTEGHRVVVPKGAVVDAGFDTWIVRNLSRLSAGVLLEVPVLVPEFHRVLTFSVKRIGVDPARPSEIRIELKPSSWFLRALSTPLVVSYDARSRELKGFTGVSDIKGPDGKNFKVSMRYRGWSSSP